MSAAHREVNLELFDAAECDGANDTLLSAEAHPHHVPPRLRIWPQCHLHTVVVRYQTYFTLRNDESRSLC